jgi:hypothetical protein
MVTVDFAIDWDFESEETEMSGCESSGLEVEE